MKTSTGLNFKTCLAAIFYVLKTAVGISPQRKNNFSISQLLSQSLNRNFKDRNDKFMETNVYIIDDQEFEKLINMGVKIKHICAYYRLYILGPHCYLFCFDFLM